jgi:acetyl esterase/lipase
LLNVVGVVAPRLYGPRLALFGSVSFIVVMILLPQIIVLGLLFTALLAWLGGLGTLPGQLGLAVHCASWLLLAQHLWHMRRTVPILDGRPVRDEDPVWAERPFSPGEVSFLPYLSFRTAAMSQVRVRRKIVYRTVDGVRLVLDVYSPRAPAARPRPSILYIHGGAWVVGSRRQSPFMMFELAAAGYVVFAIEYRHAPRFPLPAAIVDCKAAVAWIRRHAAEYGASPEVTVLGGSAGGHLASMVALSANDRAFQPGFEDEDTAVRAAVLFYGLYEFESRVQDTAPQFLRRFFEGVVFGTRYQHAPEVFLRAQTTTHVSAAAPPILIIHGQFDTLVPIGDSRLLYRKLRAVGARAHLCEVPLAQHAFEIVPSPLHQRTLRILRAFLSDALG